MRIDPSELVAATDIASELGVSQAAVSNWHARHVEFPQPVVRVANGKTPLWLRSDVLKWYATRASAGQGDLQARIDRHRAIVKALEAAKKSQ